MSKALRILLADDDKEDQDILKEYLHKENPDLSIHCVFTGKDAISWLNSCSEEEFPSLIVLDYKMPIMDAVETLDIMNNDARYISIPKVVWSTSIQNAHKNLCIAKGARRYFSKPGDPKELAMMARQMLEIMLSNEVDKQ